MKKKIILAIVALAVAGGIWYLVSRPATVAVCRVETKDLNRRLVVMGRVTPQATINVATTFPGRVKEVTAQENETVAKGSLLIALDEKELQANLKVAEAAVSQSRAKLEQIGGTEARVAEESLNDAKNKLSDAQKNFERDKQLFDKQALSQSELQRSELALKTAQTQYDIAATRERSIAKGGNDYNLAKAALEQAMANRDLARQRLTDARIFAPFDATVLARSVEPGAVAQPGQTLMVIAAAKECYLAADIEERNLGMVTDGQKALVSTEAFPDRRFDATVYQIARTVDPQRGTVRVKLAVAEKPEYLRTDMTVSIDLDVEKITSALLVPAAAVTGEGKEASVLVLNDGRIEKRPVVIAEKENGKVRIVEGANPGDLVVVPGDKEPPVEGSAAQPAEQGGC
ncbi:MAG TPA: efflux RND transporter periplasmic adaptor subunit [bacterium]|nr:efflux RND transporter periplasmic adaptor subunit [bacterium]